nr:hypothetical protein [Tanacetum cinerariifolium]
DGQILETLKKMDSFTKDVANVDKLFLLLQTKKVAALRVRMSKKRKLGELLGMGDCMAQQPVKYSDGIGTKRAVRGGGKKFRCCWHIETKEIPIDDGNKRVIIA